MGHVGSKTKSQGQILQKPCVCSRDQIFSLVLMKLRESVCLLKSCTCLKLGHFGSKSRSPGQIIEDPMLVTKGVVIKIPAL